jgi:hypothetical protein
VVGAVERDLLVLGPDGEGVVRFLAWETIEDAGRVIGLSAVEGGGAISLEPGGQFELSGIAPPPSTADSPITRPASSIVSQPVSPRRPSSRASIPFSPS